MNPHDANYLDQRNKILNMKPQHLINPEQKGIRNRFLSWILKDVDIDVLNVKHLQVYGKNTLTTPKIAVIDSSSDPENNGEITRNGDTLKIKTQNNIISMGRAIVEDGNNSNISSLGTTGLNTTVKGLLNPTSYAVRSSITLTPTVEKNKIVLSGAIASFTKAYATGTIFRKITENGIDVIPEISDIPPHFDIATSIISGIVTNAPTTPHTYDLQAKISTDGNTLLGYATMYGAILGLE